MTTKQYWSQAPLDDPARQIRLLQFEDDGSTEKLEFSCSHWSLNEAPRFSAISYTWEHPARDHLLDVDGLPYYVQHNSRYASWQARVQFPWEFAWIDFICINQSALEEKNFQVAMMGDIYSQACRVIACVGSHADDSEFIFTMMRSEEDPKGVLDAFSLDGYYYAEWMLSQNENELHRLCRTSYALEGRTKEPV